ncbi:MAG: hypothetical protein JJE10_05655 [Thermoleophilia bacterium]|nr:hypothetical protein [Thermoleophilia bacterium]
MTDSDTPGDGATKKPTGETGAEGPGTETIQPSLEDVRQWVGYRVDEISGHGVARVEAVLVDQESGEPAWLVAKLGRFGKMVPISIRECAAAAGKVWVPYDREVIREAPAIDPTLPLNREQERLVLDHYGIPEAVGRGAEIASRSEGQVTSQAPATPPPPAPPPVAPSPPA